MPDYCKNCGTKLNKNNQFCPDCGTPIENKSDSQPDRNRYIIIALIAIIAVLAIGVLFSAGLFNSEIPMESHDFGGITMLAPKGSSFVEFSSMEPFRNIGGFIYLQNEGNYSQEVNVFGVNTIASVPSEVSHVREDEGVQIFKDDTIDDLYFVTKTDGDYYLSLMGRDCDAMVKMLKSANITDNTILKSKSSSNSGTTQSSTTSSSGSSTPSSLSILGGSFSTGSAESDKTYASINVGSQNAGKDVIVQIWYSRDGNTLNNGNMVPATVHSDGYLEIASADAYHYYPDHATINIYDSNSHLLTTKSVSLSPQSGTQTF